jgi:hypothetical protein
MECSVSWTVQTTVIKPDDTLHGQAGHFLMAVEGSKVGLHIDDFRVPECQQQEVNNSSFILF